MSEYEPLAERPYTTGHECVAIDVDPTRSALLTATIARVLVRNVTDGSMISMIDPKAYVSTARFGVDGVHVLVCDRSGNVRMFSGHTGAPTSETRALGVQTLALSVAHGSVVVATKAGIVELDGLSLETKRTIVSGPFPSRIESIAISSDGVSLYATLADRLVGVDFASGGITFTRVFADCQAAALAVAPNGTTIVTSIRGAWDGLACTSAADGGVGPVWPYSLPRGVSWPVPAVVPSQSGLDAAAEAMAKLGLDPKTLKVPTGPTRQEVAYETTPVWSPDGATIAISTRDGRLAIVDASTLALRGIHPRGPGLAFIESLAWFSDGSRLAVGTADGRASIVAPETGQMFLEARAAG